MTLPRPHRAKQFVFSELRTTLNALRDLHNRALRKVLIDGRFTLFPDKADRNPWATERVVPDSFILEENPDHLEESVLIAMDYLVTDNSKVPSHPVRYEPFRIDIHAATDVELQPRKIGPLHGMELGPLEIDGLNGQNRA